jgi:hypothetical protein
MSSSDPGETVGCAIVVVIILAVVGLLVYTARLPPDEYILVCQDRKGVELYRSPPVTDLRENEGSNSYTVGKKKYTPETGSSCQKYILPRKQLSES